MSLRKKFQIVADTHIGLVPGVCVFEASAPNANDFENCPSFTFVLNVAFDCFREITVVNGGLSHEVKSVQRGDIFAEMTFADARKLAARILEVCEVADIEAKKAGLRRAK